MEVLVVFKDLDIVRVDTKIGSFNGQWCSQEPIVAKKYIVELDTDEVLTSDDIEISDFRNPYIECLNDKIYVTGLIETVEDNVMILRLQESIMMVEISSNTVLSNCIGHYVRIRLRKIKLYDTGVS